MVNLIGMSKMRKEEAMIISYQGEEFEGKND